MRKAVALNDAGVKIPARSKVAKEPLVAPAYFRAALQHNKLARTTFEKFSPSHQRAYIEWVTEAKREQTRAQRLATTMEWLAEGKSLHWKHQPKRS